MRFILISIFAILFTVSHAQTEKNFKYRVFEMQEIYNDEDGYYVSSTEFTKVDYLLVGRVDKHQLIIYANPEVTYDFVEDLVNKKDEIGDWSKTRVVDKRGLRPTLRMVIFSNTPNTHIATLYIDYKNLTRVYRLKEY